MGAHPMSETTVTALIAEDEPLLARALATELARAWPELRIVAQVADGNSAHRQALALQPDVLFLDIRMPGLSGLEAAAALAEDWPSGGKAFPHLVFVTAYDQYAVEAFDRQAVDYVLKPVRPERLARTVARLRQRVAASGAIGSDGDTSDEANTSTNTGTNSTEPTARPNSSANETPPPPGFSAAQWASVLAAQTLAQAPLAAPAHETLQMLQVSVSAREGSAIRMLPVAEVCYFEAADKYVRVLTADHEYLIRTPVKDLLAQLDPQQFWQVHRSTLVRATAIDRVLRDESGKLLLQLHQRPERIVISRLYAQRFKAM